MIVFFKHLCLDGDCIEHEGMQPWFNEIVKVKSGSMNLPSLLLPQSRWHTELCHTANWSRELTWVKSISLAFSLRHL